jgi:hypothetical protein
MKKVKVSVGRQNQLARIRKNGGYVAWMSNGIMCLANGGFISANLVRNLLGEGFLLSQNDGLLSDMPQTYVINDALLASAVLFARRTSGPA